ncbi:hypothetical protein CDL15_Pgr009336 [Punica granatum]|uniref:AB hydrolase-1 domain-containing protein n=1 Tax=Punica granatum TaxID=22663 RepID=A0A218XHC8_PUNGR|nr:hypothetical protein CDL15_Pgr009336 [Punica granatum]
MLPIPSFFSLVTLWETYLRRCFTASGLSPRAVEVDLETKTTIHFWGPAVRPDPQKPSLVLVHGFGPIAIWQWRKQVQFFAPHFNVYVPDLLFFGGSTTASSERSEIFQAESLGKLLVMELKLERFSIAGTSYGGFVAYRMAEMWPEKVDKVVIASSGLNLRKRDNEGLLKRAGLEKIEELMLPTNPGQLRTLVDLAVFKRLNMAPNFLLIDIINKLYSENRKEKMELLKGVTLGKDDNPHISRLQQEVLLLWGEHDQLFPLEMATELKQLLGEKVKLEVMKNTSHVPQIEAPLRFNNIVKSFLCGPSS